MAVSAGKNGVLPNDSAYRFATFDAGLRATLRAASSVLAGTTPADEAVAVNSVLQVTPPATAQPSSRFAIVLSVAAGELPFAANVIPGLLPMLTSANAAAVANAFCRPETFVPLA